MIKKVGGRCAIEGKDGLLDMELGQDKNDDPRAVAQSRYDALMACEGDVVTGLKNKVQFAVAKVTPAQTLVRKHRKLAETGSGN